MESPIAVQEYELKYCERCGGLWLRPANGVAVYCAPCAIQMNQLPPRKPPRGTREAAAMRTAALLLTVSIMQTCLGTFVEAFS